MTLFQNVILLTNRYGNLWEMLEMDPFLKYVDLYLNSEWGRFYVGHSVPVNACTHLATVRYGTARWPNASRDPTPHSRAFLVWKSAASTYENCSKLRTSVSQRRCQ
jgi:hypothetical protein